MATESHRILAGDGVTILFDDLNFEGARERHHELTDKRVAHFWQSYGGPRTGWNSVAGLWAAVDGAAPMPPDAIYEGVV